MKLEPGAHLTEELFELFSWYMSNGHTADVILEAFPMMANAIIWERSSKPLINEALLLAIGTCVHHRSRIGLAGRAKPVALDQKFKSLAAEISTFTDKAARNAVILQLIGDLVRLGDASETSDRLSGV